MPDTLVELRHDCTHQRLPSLARFRYCADQALLWLHEHYWLPQKEKRHETTRFLRATLNEYRTAIAARCAGGEPPLRKHVNACALTIEKALPFTQISSHLVPSLLDDGFIAPRPLKTPNDASARGGGWPPPEDATADTATDALYGARCDVELLKLAYGPLLQRFFRLKYWDNTVSFLMLSCAQRLCDEAEEYPGSPPPEMAHRFRALQMWCLHILEASDATEKPDEEQAAAAAAAAAGSSKDPLPKQPELPTRNEDGSWPVSNVYPPCPNDEKGTNWVTTGPDTNYIEIEFVPEAEGGGHNLIIDGKRIKSTPEEIAAAFNALPMAYKDQEVYGKDPPPPPGVPAPDYMLIEPRALTQVVWYAVRTMHGFGRPIVMRAQKHEACPSHDLKDTVKRLVQLQDGKLPSAEESAECLRRRGRCSYGRDQTAGDCRGGEDDDRAGDVPARQRREPSYACLQALDPDGDWRAGTKERG